MTDNETPQAGEPWRAGQRIAATPNKSPAPGFLLVDDDIGDVELERVMRNQGMKRIMKRPVGVFTSAMISAGFLVASAYAQSPTGTNRSGNVLPSSPGGQILSVPALTHRPSLTN